MTENPEKGSSRASAVDLGSKEFYSKFMSSSSSKMQYSMSKSPRFKESVVKKDQDTKFYDLPSVASNRSASFGYGQKLDISRLANNSPPPGSYTLESDFQRKRPNSIAIGLGRDLVKVNGAFQPKPFQVPGPCSYKAEPIPSQQKVSFSGRNVDLTDKWMKSVPGPGAYKTLELLDRGSSSVSKYVNPKSGRFSKADGRDELDKYLKKQDIPGPGQYKNETHEVIQKFNRHQGQRFGRSSRPSIARPSFAPGPGSYSSLSDFVK